MSFRSLLILVTARSNILICAIMLYNLHIECVINNDDTYIAYVFPKTDTEQIQKQTYSQYSGSHLPFFCVIFLSYTFDLFDAMYEKYHRNAFNPFLNSEKNDAKHVGCEQDYASTISLVDSVSLFKYYILRKGACTAIGVTLVDRVPERLL